MPTNDLGEVPVEVDVLIVGAGISGIGTAAQLNAALPDTSFAILEARDTIGGTWSLFRFPGVRSDSDMATFGFGFKPWMHPSAIAEGDLILDYLQETVDDYGLAEHILFGHRVITADFERASARWTVVAHRTDGATAAFRARFLFLGTGYYDYDRGHAPDIPGQDDFEGTVVHPQHWPEDLDYTGQQVVIIGSGATAVTLVPAMAGTAAHVTMLQRSPSYVLSLPQEDAVATLLRRVVSPQRAHRIVRRKNIIQATGLYQATRRAPALMRRFLIGQVRHRLPDGYDVTTHFSPRYDPWDERLCLVPDGDLFEAISSGAASVATDRIVRFTPTGLLLESGAELTADLVVTATGLTMLPMGRAELRVDGEPVVLPECYVYKAMMLSGVPNLAFAMGYSNLSWTLKVDLVAEHLVRLLRFMQERGYAAVEPVLPGEPMEQRPILDLQSGYVRRGIDLFPHAGDRGPWTVRHHYRTDVKRLRHGPIEDPALRFTR